MAKTVSPLAKKIADSANAVSKDRDCDVFLFNFGIEPGLEHLIRVALRARRAKRPNLLLFLTTEGGDPDTAYRLARLFQDCYERITIVVGGWCKSAGTLLCIAAEELIICDGGELGPLDIQIAKADEVGERSSGLAVDAAFEKLQKESFKLFINYLTDIKAKTGGRITFRTAADIAANLVVGATSGVFEKFDPLTIGEDHRSNLVAADYAMRLNLRAANLRMDRRFDALEMLLNGYRTHSFVIDRKEASSLFLRVAAPEGTVAELVGLLGKNIVMPRNTLRDEQPRWEYLNAEKRKRREKPKKAASADGAASRRKRGSNEQSANDVSRNLPARSGEERPRRSAA